MSKIEIDFIRKLIMPKITQKDILQDVKNISQQIERIPTKKDYCKYGKFGMSTVMRNFQYWNDVLSILFNMRRDHPSTKNIITFSCQTCSKKVQQSEVDYKRSKNHFCSRNCAATYNNKNRINKRIKTQHFCIICKKPRKSKRTKHCATCLSLGRHLHGGKPLEEKTLQETICLKGTNRYRVIRDHATKVAEMYSDTCAICGYTKHVEVCHIKEIHKFSLDTLIKEVNHPSNLVKLCRNHHWELDHNLLESPFTWPKS